jgi:hypothetical protein
LFDYATPLPFNHYSMHESIWIVAQKEIFNCNFAPSKSIDYDFNK